MNRYIQNLKSFLLEQSSCFSCGDAHSILEIVYYYYSSENHVDNAGIRCRFRELDSILQRLPLAENDAVFSLTGELCAEYEKQAFLDGIQVGMRLFTELEDDH